MAPRKAPEIFGRLTRRPKVLQDFFGQQYEAGGLYNRDVKNRMASDSCWAQLLATGALSIIWGGAGVCENNDHRHEQPYMAI